mmetsp:Transcript_24980/g.40094  ORF Transcript_24980/g.40094 Transcript_24980/m.40094 type:complete len:210 (-) Transcript_24980:1070-1699(-)
MPKRLLISSTRCSSPLSTPCRFVRAPARSSRCAPPPACACFPRAPMRRRPSWTPSKSSCRPPRLWCPTSSSPSWTARMRGRTGGSPSTISWPSWAKFQGRRRRWWTWAGVAPRSCTPSSPRLPTGRRTGMCGPWGAAARTMTSTSSRSKDTASWRRVPRFCSWPIPSRAPTRASPRGSRAGAKASATACRPGRATAPRRARRAPTSTPA